MTAIGWDDPRTVARYEAFCAAHDRYEVANAALVRAAALAPGLRVLDVGAGTGGTAACVLAATGGQVALTCVEPARAMREAGARRLGAGSVTWSASLPAEAGGFDRVLAGAAIWQLTPIAESLRRLAGLLAPGGALVFDVPALYVGEPEGPGGGADPMLLGMPAWLGRGRTSKATAGEPIPRAEAMTRLLDALDLRVEIWSFEVRLTQAMYRDWLKIPVILEPLLGDVEPEARDGLIDEAFAASDASSWRDERWIGWTAWRRGGTESSRPAPIRVN